MRMIVPRMTLTDFFVLAGDLKKDPRFHISNQDWRGGHVYFADLTRLGVLKDIMDYHNFRDESADVVLKGWKPVSTLKRNAMTAAKMDKLGFDLKGFMASVERLKGPNSDGFYHARCPSCARVGKDSDYNHCYITEQGVVGCFSGCSFKEICEGFYEVKA